MSYEDSRRDADYDEKVDGPVRTVQLDGLVLLKIIKHSKEQLPDYASGQLLGLDVNGVLEVTHSFPTPATENEEAQEAFQESMMRCLRQVNVDNNTVGWYQSAFLGSFVNKSTIETQFDYQRAIPSSVLIIYDPSRTKNGRLAVKAYRLTSEFMRLASSKNYSLDSFTKADVSSDDILQELPLKVHNPHLVHAFLYEMRENRSMSCDFERLTISSNRFLERNLDMLTEQIDAYSNEQSKFQYYQRQVARLKQQQQEYIRKIKSDNEARVAAGQAPLPEEDVSKNPMFKPVPAPNRLDTLLISKQIQHHCQQVNSNAAQGFQKMYIVDALHK